jgi:hypothetical protein
MPKIVIIPKKHCRVYSKVQYILPKSVHKPRVYGLFKYIHNAKSKRPVKSSSATIYVAGGNGWLTFVTLVHEICHYINIWYLGNNKKIDKCIETYL